jgi:triacylglycerol lipase
MPRFTETAIRRFAGLDAFPLPPIIPVRYPVVLMHGFGMLAGLRRGGHFRDTAESLRLRGVRAYAPNVAPYNTVEARGSMWIRRIEHVLAETRSSKVNLIAHSMGGLDARWIIAHRGLGDRVGALVTVSTPHRGSSLAEYILSSPDRIRNWLTDVANWMGTQIVDDGGADFRTAVAELTPSNVIDNFNSAVIDDERVRYWSYAGVAGRGCDHSTNPFLRLFNNYLYDREGINDGMVSVESAKWGDYLGEISADHAQQIGAAFPGSSGFSPAEFYASVAEMLANHDF